MLPVTLATSNLSNVQLEPHVYVTILGLFFAISILWSGRSTIRHLPFPQGAEWIWGHEKAVFIGEAGRAFDAWIKEVGLTFRIKAAFGARDVLVLCDPGGIAYILQKKIYDYHHSKVVRPRIARLLGRGLGWVEGEAEHKRMRHLVSPALSPESIKSSSQEVIDAASAVINELTLEVQSHNGDLMVNVLEWNSKATLNVIGRAAFGHDFEAGNSKDAVDIIYARRRGVSPIVKYAGFITLMLLRRFSSLNDLPISAIQAQGIVKQTIHSGVANEMLLRNKDVDRGSKSNDLLARLLQAHSRGQISYEELFEQISTFLIAGHETTTQALGFAVFELARNQKSQQRLREELEAFPGDPIYEDYFSCLPYLDAVLRETLRLYPGLPYMERVATKADTIPLRHPVKLPNGKVVNQISITPGQTIIIPIVSIHRMDSVWSDGNIFRPERWLEPLPPQDRLCSGWANTLAFSDGPRNCIGSRFAIFQFKVILTNLMRRFVFKDSGVELTLKVASTIQPWVVGDMDKGPQLPVILEAI